MNIPQHIVLKGLMNQPCFYEPEDYAFYLSSIQAAADQYLCDIHAYAVLKNSVQLIATPRMPNGVPSMMQSIGRRYVQYFNGRYRRNGSLWGRYKSSLLDPNAYLLSCYRYIEQQPLQHAAVLDLDAYPWSSYRHHAGLEVNPLLRDHQLYIELGEDSEERGEAYLSLFRYNFDAGLYDYIDEMVHSGQILGGDRFKDQIELIANRRVRPLRRGRPRKDNKNSLPES